MIRSIGDIAEQGYKDASKLIEIRKDVVMIDLFIHFKA